MFDCIFEHITRQRRVRGIESSILAINNIGNLGRIKLSICRASIGVGGRGQPYRDYGSSFSYPGCVDSVDWNGGMEWWNGLDWTGMEWNGMTRGM